MDELIERCPRVAELDEKSLSRLNMIIDDVDEFIWVHVGPFGAIWDLMVHSGDIWDHMKPYGAIGD